MTTKTDTKDECLVGCHPIQFELTIKNAVEPQPNLPSFTVSAMSGQTLLQALTTFGTNNPQFGFQTRHVSDCGPYVVSVTVEGEPVGTNGSGQFWETLLKNNGDIIPIGLKCYNVCDQDNIYLRFAPF
ncbi:uncharacterized protein LOC139929323 [Centroberyx gerrardi]